MPDLDQITELLNECMWLWYDGEVNKYNDSSLAGYLVIGGSGNSIFLPAAGMTGLGGFIANYGRWGYLWSRTLADFTDSSDGCIKAYSLNFSKNRNDNAGTYRYDGKSVRAVRSLESSSLK